MTRSQISPELEARIRYLEDPINQGQGFGQSDWAWLLILGIVGPVVLLVLGWFL